MPRIYVAVLADYNAGRLTGEWIDLDGMDLETLQDRVTLLLSKSTEPNVTRTCPACSALDATEPDPECELCHGKVEYPSAEEYAIHDHEGFPEGVQPGEYTPLSEIVETVEMLEEHGEAWAAYADHVGREYATKEAFEDAYCGTWDSEQAYAENLLEDMGTIPNDDSVLSQYFDYKAFTRDLFMSDYFSANTSEGVAVFRCN